MGVDVDVDGALVTLSAGAAEGVGVDRVGDVLEPSEKKPTGGVADFRDWVDAGVGAGTLDGPSVSRDTFARPLVSEGGRNAVDGAGGAAGPSISASSAYVAPNGGASVFALGGLPASRLGARNTSPGPPPPPRTRSSFFSMTGTGCFGAGSIPRREDCPAPVLGVIRGFFAGGLSSTSSSGGGREGRLMAIFLVRFGLEEAALEPVAVIAVVSDVELEGAGRGREDEEDFGGGSANVDLEAGGGSLGGRDDVDGASVGCEIDVVVVFDEPSSPLSMSLP